MKKIVKISTISLLAVIFIGGGTAFAQNVEREGRSTTTRVDFSRQRIEKKHSRLQENASTTRATFETKRKEAHESASTTRSKIQGKKGELQANVQARHMENVKKFASKTIERLNEAIRRLSKIADRLDSRIAKMDTVKLDTTKAKADMRVVREKLAEAQTKLTAAQTAITAITSNPANTDTTGTDTYGNILSTKLQSIKDQTKTVNDSIKSAKQALVVVTADIKISEGKTKETTTASTTHQ